ncbi:MULTISPECIES: hypothetical protein [Enterobacteriaceae]|uniref:hypothetical protein n=1 Tax=Enterobacteriaceae TaxID=543 RepID=UPI0011279309|nr:MULTISPECIES: hypothetical protein [Enterobacteriaceae]EGF7331216.1 hypothetical protein [Escherichia coli]EGF7395700.1 hypothetical protein [Escherichia coli]EJQ5572806.1 hypothetical protein [Escherichia coli]EJQ5587220.1 hypothetical protein [Escherichia coli]EKJ3283520.1 hypothetical protein [Escherichia coli]
MKCKVYGGGYHGDEFEVADGADHIMLPLKSALNNSYTLDEINISISSFVRFDILIKGDDVIASIL